MRLALGFSQFASAHYWGSERHREYLDQAEVGAKRRVVSMPPAGWATLARRLSEEAFTKWGKGRPSKLTGEKSGTRSAAHTISRHLAELEAHPAFRGQAVLGYSEAAVCAWRVVDGWWSPYPRRGQEMVVLIPRLEDRMNLRDLDSGSGFRSKITYWTPAEWGVEFYLRGLHAEDEHLGWSDAYEAAGA